MTDEHPEETDEQAAEMTPDTTSPGGKMLWHELEDNVLQPSGQPPGLVYEGPGEPGEGTELEDSSSGEVIPGVLGGPPVVVTREEDPDE